MNVSRESLTCKIVLLAIFLTPAAAFFDEKSIEYLPFSILLIYLLFLLYSKKIRLSFSGNFYLLILFLTFYILTSLLIHKSILSIGSVSVILLSIIFYKILDYNNLKLKVLVRDISNIYIIMILFIIIEIILSSNGYQPIIKDLMFSDSVKIYKDYNSAVLLKYTGIYEHNVGGPNSLLLGSQSASMLTFFSLLWFSNIFYGNKFQATNIRWPFFFLVSLFLYPFVATMTINITGVLLLFCLIFLFVNSKLNKLKYHMLIILGIITFHSFLYELIFFRVANDSDKEIYLAALTGLPKLIFELEYFELLFGVGINEMKEIVKSSTDLGITSDFGLMYLTIQSGIFLFLLAFIPLTFITLKALKLISVCKKKFPNYLSNPWFSMMSINLIIVLGEFLSLAHYTTAIEAGGRFLFSLHIAITLVSLKKINEIIFTNKKSQ